jgi:hypothetical protein
MLRRTRGSVGSCRVQAVCMALLASLVLGSFMSTVVGVRTVSFAGYTWQVKSGYGGPASNYWSDSSESVWVDNNGYLHLKIRNINGVWYCSEVFLPNSLGYGQYVFHVAGRVDSLKPNIVMGLFLYQSDRREVDIEFSRWGDPNRIENAQYVISPSKQPNNMHRFTISQSVDYSTHIIDWVGRSVNFRSMEGASALQEWAYQNPANRILQEGRERLHINLWLCGTRLAGVSYEQEIVITGFEFTPV